MEPMERMSSTPDVRWPFQGVSLLFAKPDRDRAKDNASAVHDGEFVVAGGDAAPLFVVPEGTLDDVAVLVSDLVEVGRMRVTEVKRSDVHAWRWNGPPGRTRTQGGKAYELLVSAFDDAVMAELVDSTPCTLRGAGSPGRAREPRSLPFTEVDRFLAAAAGAPVREIQAMLGHTAPMMALQYQTATRERDAEHARNMSDRWLAARQHHSSPGRVSSGADRRMTPRRRVPQGIHEASPT